MKLLAALVEACHGHRGGALASVIHSFVLQGNDTLKNVILKILVQVLTRFYRFIFFTELNWVFAIFYASSPAGLKIRFVSHRILATQVCRPLYEMLMLWVFEGELRDPYGEFFIGVNLAAATTSLWNDKYYERRV